MNTQGLYEYQIPAAKQLLAALELHGAALDASDCGLGKSYHAGAVIRELELPSLVVCPKIAVTAWGRVLDYLGTSACIKNWEALRTGNLPYGFWQHPLPPASERKVDYFCAGCQCRVDVVRTSRCPVRPSGIHCVEPKKSPHNYGRFTWYEGIKLIVFDECHVAGGLDSLNADLVVAAKRQNILSLFLSATCADSPLGFKALGFALGLHGGPSSFYTWAKARGCSRPVFGGLHWLVSDERKKIILSALHHDLFPSRGVRVRVSEISNFPSCSVRAELFDLENSGRIDELYSTMNEAISELNSMKSTDKDAEHPLTKLLRASQAVELLKVPLFISLRDEILERGHSAFIGVNYTQTLHELLKRMKTKACIVGGQSTAERDHWITEFQENREHTLVTTIPAGGVSISLQDLKGRPREGLSSAHPSAVKMRQFFGRLPRAGALSPSLYRIPLVANSVEEKIHKRLASKLNSLDALNDSDLTACNLPLTVGDLGTLLEEKHL